MNQLRSWVDGNLRKVWDTAVSEIQDVQQIISDWQQLKPEGFDLSEFYGEYVWAVYCAGFRIEVLDSLWGRMREVLCEFDVKRVTANRGSIRNDLLSVIHHEKKAEAVLITAAKLANRPQIWNRLQRIASKYAVLDEVTELSGIGPVNRYHLVRNLGWDVPTHGGFTKALADNLRTDCDTLMEYMAKVSGYRVSTTDAVISMWGHTFQTDQECIDRFRVLIGLD